MESPRFTSNLDDDTAHPDTIAASIAAHAKAKVDKARADLRTTVTGLAAVVLVVAIVVAPAVVVAAYRWAF